VHLLVKAILTLSKCTVQLKKHRVKFLECPYSYNIRGVQLHHVKTCVWCTLSMRGIPDPMFYADTISSER